MPDTGKGRRWTIAYDLGELGVRPESREIYGPNTKRVQVMPVSEHEAALAKARKEAEKHCKEVEEEASEMVDDTVDAWVDRLDAFEQRFRAEVKSRMQRIGNSSSVLAADVEAALDIANAAVRVTGAGSPSQVLARQWRSRAEKAEAERDQARKEGREEVRETLREALFELGEDAHMSRLAHDGELGDIEAEQEALKKFAARLDCLTIDSLTKEGD